MAEWPAAALETETKIPPPPAAPIALELRVPRLPVARAADVFLGARAPDLGGTADVELEIRPLYEIDDFGDAFSPELKADAERIMARS